MRTKLEQLATQEVAALGHAQELFANEHYDLSVMEAWKAVEARLRRALLGRKVMLDRFSPDGAVHAAKRLAIIREPALGLLQELKRDWDIAVSNEPLSRQRPECGPAHFVDDFLAGLERQRWRRRSCFSGRIKYRYLLANQQDPGAARAPALRPSEKERRHNSVYTSWRPSW